MQSEGILEAEQIRLVDLETREVVWHSVDDSLPWKEIWTISHVWDRPEPISKTRIPLKGVSWASTSFSSVVRFNRMFDETLRLVKPRGARYVWLDAACIDQDEGDKADLERKMQIPFAGTIYARSAGCVAFGMLTSDDNFVEIVSTSKDGQKAWVCDWFERVWTFQELKLPKELLFVSGDRILTRDQLYFYILMMSPYLTPSHPPFPANPNDTHISAQEVMNALSPALKSTTQRLLMQTSKRGCSLTYINDKIYGMLGVLPESLAKPKVNYKISLNGAVLNLMLLMSTNDILDTLTFNTSLPLEGINAHDAVHWSGMVRLDGPPTEHPSYETDIYPTETTAHVVVDGDPPLAYTVVDNGSLWTVKITPPENLLDSDTPVRAWPSISTLSQHFDFKGDFSKVQPAVDYALAVGRAERSLAKNWALLEPMLEKAVKGAESNVAKGEFSSILKNKPVDDAPRGIPPNRLGNELLFNKTVTVLHCRSKEDESFHYGIVVRPNGGSDGTWHKVCTTAFSSDCVVARERVENLFVIGR